jgi:cobalt-zinc-cadmium efflux system membrane fusion protein
VDLPQPDHRQDAAPSPETQRAAAARRLPRKAQFAILGAVAVLLVAGLVFGPAQYRELTMQPAAAPEAPAVQDNLFRPTPQQWAGFHIQAVQEQRFSPAQDTDGKIAIDDDLVTPVFSPYSGRVVKLYASAGDSVRGGDPLVAVQASEFVQAQNDLIAAVAALRTARAQATLAGTTEKRQHDLYLAHGGALKDWQQAQVDLASAEGNRNSAEIALAAVRNRLRILGRSDLEIAQMEADQHPDRIDPVAIVGAPIAGTVIQRQVGLGQTIISAASGATAPLFEIGDLSKVWLVANVREEEAPLIRLGDPIEVHVLAFPGRTFTARVTHIAPQIDTNTHRLLVRAELDNPDQVLKPEMFASFRIITGNATQALALPVGALVYEGSDVHVWVADPARKTIASRDVRLGAIQDGMAEVLSGLQPGDHVVTVGSLFIDRAVTGD